MRSKKEKGFFITEETIGGGGVGELKFNERGDEQWRGYRGVPPSCSTPSW